MPRALLYGVFLAGVVALPETTHAQTPVSTQWIASGFVGADFGGLADGSSFDLGGQLGFLYQHFSNAGLTDPNPSLNLLGLQLGFTRSF